MVSMGGAIRARDDWSETGCYSLVLAFGTDPAQSREPDARWFAGATWSSVQRLFGGDVSSKRTLEARDYVVIRLCIPY